MIRSQPDLWLEFESRRESENRDHGKKATQKNKSNFSPEKIVVRPSGLKKAKRKSSPRKKSSSSKGKSVAKLITTGPAISKFVNEQDSLTDWFNFYLKANADPHGHTFKAKLQDIERFLQFFHEKHRTYHCDKWTPSITKSFIKWLPKQKARDRSGNETKRTLAPSTCARVVDTLKHAAKWIHRQRSFLTGYPFDKQDVIDVEEPEWQGLSDLQVTRMKSASEQLVHLQTRADQFPRRTHTQLLLLLGIPFRVDEMNALNLDQYQGKHLVNDYRSKGNKVNKRLFLDKPIRDALNDYIKNERGKEPGPLFVSKTGKRLAQSNIYNALGKIADQVNASLPKDEQIEIHPHLLRHTSLRKLAKRDIRLAREVSGLKSDKYLWRYIKATEEEVEEGLTGLWE